MGAIPCRKESPPIIEHIRQKDSKLQLRIGQLF